MKEHPTDAHKDEPLKSARKWRPLDFFKNQKRKESEKLENSNREFTKRIEQNIMLRNLNVPGNSLYTYNYTFSYGVYKHNQQDTLINLTKLLYPGSPPVISFPITTN